MAVNLEHSNDYSFSPHNSEGCLDSIGDSQMVCEAQVPQFDTQSGTKNKNSGIL